MSQRSKQPLVPAQKAPTPASLKPSASPPTRAAQIAPASAFRQSAELPTVEPLNPEVRALERTAGNRTVVNQRVAQRITSASAENRTGMPDPLKEGLEQLSGLDMSDVRVQYNSSKPAEIQALAYAQGNQIHLGPGQERHLPHEAWHVVQQKQGRVRPTAVQRKELRLNDDLTLEREAERMGDAALHAEPGASSRNLEKKPAPAPVAQPYMEFLVPIAEYLGVDATVAAVAAGLGISPGILIGGLMTLGTFAVGWAVNKLIAWLVNGPAPGPQPLPGNAQQPVQQGVGAVNAQQPVQQGVGAVNAQQPVQQGVGAVNAQQQPAVDPAAALQQQWLQVDRPRARQADTTLWEIRYSDLALARQRRAGLNPLAGAWKAAFEQNLADPANLLAAQGALVNLMQYVDATLPLIAAGQARRATFYVRLSHRVVEQIHLNPAAAVPGGNAYAQQRLADYQTELGAIQVAFNAAVAAPNPNGIGVMTYKGVNFDVDTNNNNYISAAGQPAQQYPARPLSPVNFKNLINAMIDPNNATWQGYNHRDLAIFLAAIFVEPSRYAPSRVTNLIAAGREADYTAAGQQSIFNVLPMTTGGTDPAANPTHPGLVGQAGTLPTQATGDREVQMVVEPNRGWIEDKDHLKNLNYTDAQLETDLVDAQHTAMFNYLNS